MAGSIDPRCETIRGTHWPKQGRVVVWSSRRGNHLGQRSKAPHQQAGHMDASDPIRPSKKLLWHGGRPHMALANKIARIAWKLMTTGESYDGARMPGASAVAA